MGVFAVVVGLIFVGYEIQQTRDLGVADRLATAADLEISLRTTLADNATLWRRGCIGDELSEDETVAFTQLAFAVYFKQFMKWRISRSGVGDNTDLDYFPRTIAQQMYHFAGFSDAVSKFQANGSYGWSERIQRILDEMDREGAPSEADPSTCGVA